MYIINPTSGKEIPNSYPTSSSTGSNSSSSSSGSSAAAANQEIISKILTKCATMTDEVGTTTATTTTTVNGTILLSPSAAAAAAAAAHHHHHQLQQQQLPVVGVSPQSSPASSSSSASSPTADGPQPKAKSSGGTNGTAGKHAMVAGNGKLNGNGTQSLSVSGGGGSGGRLQFFKDCWVAGAYQLQSETLFAIQMFRLSSTRISWFLPESNRESDFGGWRTMMMLAGWLPVGYTAIAIIHVLMPPRRPDRPSSVMVANLSVMM
ncbi:hypothetical protein pipiens_009521 [Culex pipiens pipiens]|uniref:Uncharacterized protein n=1 Tax=Culex pipiens pipiens TaxID=38569 RepID=A0ABD1DDU1_CULPP